MKTKRYSFVAVLVAVMMATAAVVPFIGCDDADAATDYWTYTITSDGKVTGSGSAVASPTAAGPAGKTGTYTSSDGKSNVGSWGFDEDGYGPFGSFYAAFDACHGNKILCHLNPNDLTKDIDGNALSSYGDHTYNIMWVLPTVYWKVDSSGNLVLTNNPSSNGTAYAHTIDGVEHEYLGIGVYEASTTTVNGKTVLTSTSGTKPLYSQTRETFRTYANNNTVATENGTTVTGHAMLWNLYARQLYRFSVLTVGGSWNSQGVFGNGDVYGGHYGSSVNATGDLDKSGPYAGTVGNSGSSGSSTYHSNSVKAFIEDAWGSLYEFVDGVVIYGANVYATQSSKPTNNGSDYSSTPIGTLPSSSGYGSTTTTSSTEAEFWGLPTGTSGSATGGLYDYIYSDSSGSSSSPYGLYVGGCSGVNAGDAPGYGLSCMNAYFDVGTSNTFIGGRLALVFDADPASISTPTITYDHGALSDIGGDTDGLLTSDTIVEGMTYPDLNDSTCAAVQAGYTHIGWYVDNTFVAIGATVDKTESFTAYSVWMIPQITITFKVEGEVYATLSVQKNTAGVVFTPKNVTGAFEGWYLDSAYTEKYDATKKLTEDTTLYAKGVPPLVFTSVPTASATISQTSYNMYFFDATDSTGRYSVEWDFGDGNTSTDPIAYNTYTDPGHYTVTLKITNLYGDTDTKTYGLDVGDVAEQTDAPSKTPAIIGIFAVIVLSALVVRRFV